MHGTGVSPGIAIGKACVIKRQEENIFKGMLPVTESAISIEIEKYDHAVSLSAIELEALKNCQQLTAEAAEVLESHLELLTDPQIRDDVIQKIKDDKKNAHDALTEIIHDIVTLFQSMSDEYMRARAADVQDIGDRISRKLKTTSLPENRKFETGAIVIAYDISPSDTFTLDINQIAGFATCMGSRTSHTAIIAKSKEIPAVVGCGDKLMAIKDNDLIIIDGINGLVILNPDRVTVDEYEIKKNAFSQKLTFLRSLKNLAAFTTDGVPVRLTANISSAADVKDMIEYGGEGSGLFRTELLFMNRDHFPSEEEQFIYYKKVAVQSGNRPVIVRTIDIGGDKQLPYFGLSYEQNPFLGYRAIRICLDRKDVFITQLKAILRAAVFGNFKIMFPMIGNVQELRSAKLILEEAKQELLQGNIKFDENIKVGVMIEIPAAAVTADILAKEVDFFSIGTNDLCQYTLAVDRMNEKIKDLYDPFDPGVLRLISYVIEQANKHDIPVSMCGEMASDPIATRLLLGMGLQEFSMSAASIPYIKNAIVRSSIASARVLMQKVMQMDHSKNIITCLKEAQS